MSFDIPQEFEVYATFFDEDNEILGIELLEVFTTSQAATHYILQKAKQIEAGEVEPWPGHPEAARAEFDYEVVSALP